MTLIELLDGLVFAILIGWIAWLFLGRRRG